MHLNKRLSTIALVKCTPICGSLFKLLAICTVLATAVVVSYNLSCKKSGKERVLFVYGDNALVEVAKTKLSPFVDKFLEKHDDTTARRLCERLLSLNATLPTLALLEESNLRALIIGIPSEHLWERILERLSQPGDAFLAFSVEEELMPWRCTTCPPHRLLEEVWDLSSNDIRDVLEILRA